MRVPGRRQLRRAAERLLPAANLDQLRFQVGQLQARSIRGGDFHSLQDAEFQVFSQFNEDGIIQHLVNVVEVSADLFVEVGVEDYQESNTRFLLMHNNWRGVIVDSGTSHLDFLERSGLRWRHSIDGISLFVTRDNLEGTLAAIGVRGRIGLLSMDIDGNDYWVLDDLSELDPSIIVVEYNSIFGPDHAVVVPYDPHFYIRTAHPSMLYFGASLAALTEMCETKGYRLVGCTTNGVNAFFVREELLDRLRPLSASEGFVESRCRSSRDSSGRPTYLSARSAGLDLIRGLPVVDLHAGGAVRSIEDVFRGR